MDSIGNVEKTELNSVNIEKCQISGCDNKATEPLSILIYEWTPVDLCKMHADKWFEQARLGTLEYRKEVRA